MSVIDESFAEEMAAKVQAASWPRCECGEPVRRMRQTKGMIGAHPNPDGLCLRCYVRAKDAARRADRPVQPQLRRVDDLEDVQAAVLTDPRPPVRLRRLLAVDRDRYGLPFAEVFAEDAALAVRDLDESEARAWSSVFSSTRNVWRDAYDGVPSPLAHFSAETLLAHGRDPAAAGTALVA